MAFLFSDAWAVVVVSYNRHFVVAFFEHTLNKVEWPNSSRACLAVGIRHAYHFENYQTDINATESHSGRGQLLASIINAIGPESGLLTVTLQCKAV